MAQYITKRLLLLPLLLFSVKSGALPPMAAAWLPAEINNAPVRQVVVRMCLIILFMFTSF